MKDASGNSPISIYSEVDTLKKVLLFRQKKCTSFCCHNLYTLYYNLNILNFTDFQTFLHYLNSEGCCFD
jgi:hypothetical protein